MTEEGLVATCGGIVYDDNEGRVLHAHAIANKTSLAAYHQAQDAISRKLSGT